MTALEVCDYFNIACYGDYHIKIDGASARSGNRIHFIKLLDGMSIYDSSAPTFIFDVSNKTCDDFVRYVTKHNLEDYDAFSCIRSYRFIDYDDIRVDDINKEVRFV